MEKILLIEPQSILRQAVSLFLFPEYEVQVREAITAVQVESLPECDLFIIDASALREKGQLPPELMRAIEVCKIPALWLQENGSPEPPNRAKLATVKKPIEREALESAVADLLSHNRAAKGNVNSSAAKSAEGKKAIGTRYEGRAESSSQGGLEFIELVDAVEEVQVAPQQGTGAPGKSK